MSLKIASVCLFQAILIRAQVLNNAVVAHVAAAAAAPGGCTTIADVYSSCAAATAGFTDLPGAQLASCLCYNGNSWAPSIFDGAVAACATWAKTADTTEYALLTPIENFCTLEGDVRGGNAAATTTANGALTTGAATAQATATGGGGVITTGPVTACASVASIYDSCSAATPGFTNLLDAQAATCLCYNAGGTWDPSQFDGPILTCANYLKTASPPDYSTYTSLENFCTDLGNVVANAGGAASTNAGGAATTAGAKSTKSQVIIGGLPATNSLDGPSPTSTTQVTVVTVIASSSSAVTKTSKAAAAGGVVGRFSQGGNVMVMGVAFGLVTFVMCFVL